MVTAKASKSRQVRQRLDHPIIDADGHMVEFMAPIEDYVKAIAGTQYGVRFRRPFDGHGPDPAAQERRMRNRTFTFNVWTFPTKSTVDRASVALPKLLYERLDDFGIDYTVLFPSLPNLVVQVYRIGSETRTSAYDPELNRVRARASNAYHADICREYAGRMTWGAEINMETPQTGIEELEFAVKKLGAKVVSTGNYVRRPIPSVHEKHPELFPRVCWYDTFGLDSAYDYDPFWAKCLELKVPVMNHGGGLDMGHRTSPTNFMYSHLGHHADGGEAMLKSLLLGGVTARFPGLRLAFLEGGVAWGARLYSDLVLRFGKHKPEALREYLDPANLDTKLFLDLHARYGHKSITERLDQVLPMTGPDAIPKVPYNDFARCDLKTESDIKRHFERNFFFGCEADDPLNALATSHLLPLGAKLNGVFSSDIGHWDVPDMTEVLEEAYETVERGLLSAEEFRALTFTNPVKILAGANPEFFKGTIVERDVEKLAGRW